MARFGFLLVVKNIVSSENRESLAVKTVDMSLVYIR